MDLLILMIAICLLIVFPKTVITLLVGLVHVIAWIIVGALVFALFTLIA